MKLTVICKDNGVTLMDVEIVSVQVMPDMKSISVDDGILICGLDTYSKLSLPKEKKHKYCQCDLCKSLKR